MLSIIENMALSSIDGLSGLQRVDVARFFFNEELCYIGNSTPNQAYWQVNVMTIIVLLSLSNVVVTYCTFFISFSL